MKSIKGTKKFKCIAEYHCNCKTIKECGSCMLLLHVDTIKKMKVEKPVCVLVGQDGNVFNIIGRVSKALKRVGQADRANEFATKAFRAGSYNEVLNLCHDYVDVN